MIREHPELPCWSWALEYNKNLRRVGFFGNLEAVQSALSALPRSEGDSLVREATPPLQERDVLFLGEDEKTLPT